MTDATKVSDKNIKQLTLILDLDNTLVGRQGIPRPYLGRLLEFAFSEFQHVAIWTAAKQEWFDEVFDIYLYDELQSVEKKLGRKCAFAFVYTATQTEKDDTKPLSLVWENQSGVFADMNRDNTLIVDDYSWTFSRNKENGINVPHWYGSSRLYDADNVLLMLLRYLRVLLKTYETTQTVYDIDKSNWLQETRERENRTTNAD